MNVKITAKEASKYKKQKKQIEDKLKQHGRIEWSYSYCVRIEGMMSLGQLIQSRGQLPPEPTIEEKLEQFKRNASFSLCGSVGRKSRVEAIEGIPEFVLAQVKLGYEKQAKEKAEFDALSPQEQQEELNELLSQLRKSPGFMTIPIR